jgi:hypothetical protein
MMKLALISFYRGVLAFALTLAMIVSAVSGSISHMPSKVNDVEHARQAKLVSQIDDHGHSHNDGDQAERDVKHTHGHNPADHSHETQYLGSYVFSPRLGLLGSSVDYVSSFTYLGAIHRLERPPKPILLV